MTHAPDWDISTTRLWVKLSLSGEKYFGLKNVFQFALLSSLAVRGCMALKSEVMVTNLSPVSSDIHHFIQNLTHFHRVLTQCDAVMRLLNLPCTTPHPSTVLRKLCRQHSTKI